jgi:hypothetical protein
MTNDPLLSSHISKTACICLNKNGRQFPGVHNIPRENSRRKNFIKNRGSDISSSNSNESNSKQDQHDISKISQNSYAVVDVNAILEKESYLLTSVRGNILG